MTRYVTATSQHDLTPLITQYDLSVMAETKSSSEDLVDLTARATALYAVKKFEEAAELYSQATEIQSQLNGEMNPKNADLLFSYGRCLFYLAQKTSAVLGDTAASAQLKTNTEEKKGKKRKADGEVKQDVETAENVPSNAADKPLFQITGDENFDDSSDEEEEGEEDEEEDDFNTAFEILDLSRLLYLKQIEEATAAAAAPANETRTKELKVRLADVYDLLAEISLEGDKFDAAAGDLRSCLDLKLQLYPPESSFLAECHFKLSVVLEAASQVEANNSSSIAQKLRDEAVEQMKKAIESCKLRVAQEKAGFESIPDEQSDAKKKAQAEVNDVQDMLEAMEQRLEELKKPPVSVEEEAKKEAQKAMVGSVLGSLLGYSEEEQKTKIAEIAAGANDLSGMVKRKKPQPSSSVDATSGKKRIADDDTDTTNKKAKFEPVSHDAD